MTTDRYRLLLKRAGLVPTRPRLAVAGLLFRAGGRHVTADVLQQEVHAAGLEVSRATLYNTLHAFTRHGLLREIPTENGRSVFDTNVNHGVHLYFEDTGELVDVPPEWGGLDHLLGRLGGIDPARINVVIHVRTFPRPSRKAGVAE
jgi:Fur family transcriptional regulator, iron response regulator